MTDQERTKTFFAERADGYYQRNYETPENRHARNLALRRTVTLELIPETGVVLDLGCGPGAITINAGTANVHGDIRVQGALTALTVRDVLDDSSTLKPQRWRATTATNHAGTARLWPCPRHQSA